METLEKPPTDSSDPSPEAKPSSPEGSKPDILRWKIEIDRFNGEEKHDKQIRRTAELVNKVLAADNNSPDEEAILARQAVITAIERNLLFTNGEEKPRTPLRDMVARQSMKAPYDKAVEYLRSFEEGKETQSMYEILKTAKTSADLRAVELLGMSLLEGQFDENGQKSLAESTANKRFLAEVGQALVFEANRRRIEQAIQGNKGLTPERAQSSYEWLVKYAKHDVAPPDFRKYALRTALKVADGRYGFKPERKRKPQAEQVETRSTTEEDVLPEAYPKMAAFEENIREAEKQIPVENASPETASGQVSPAELLVEPEVASDEAIRLPDQPEVSGEERNRQALEAALAENVTTSVPMEAEKERFREYLTEQIEYAEFEVTMPTPAQGAKGFFEKVGFSLVEGFSFRRLDAHYQAFGIRGMFRAFFRPTKANEAMIALRQAMIKEYAALRDQITIEQTRQDEEMKQLYGLYARAVTTFIEANRTVGKRVWLRENLVGTLGKMWSRLWSRRAESEAVDQSADDAYFAQLNKEASGDEPTEFPLPPQAERQPARIEESDELTEDDRAIIRSIRDWQRANKGESYAFWLAENPDAAKRLETIVTRGLLKKVSGGDAQTYWEALRGQQSRKSKSKKEAA